ncbi:MAG: hypothetical protein ACRCYA_13390 [Cetobacterium sp.]|uniref:hypothetical protein n=1 Tax=Cetobacterium sp. TaxID=2071632 RepID=UPI003F390098
MKFLSASLIALTIFCNILEAKSFRSSSRSSTRSSSFKSSTSTRSSSTLKISSPKVSKPVIKAIRPSTPKLINTSNKNTIINNTTVVNENRSSGTSDFVNGMLIGNMLNRPSTSTVVVSSPVIRSEEEVAIKNVVTTEKKESFIFKSVLKICKIIGIVIVAIILLALIF